jgi:hypothetical protein
MRFARLSLVVLAVLSVVTLVIGGDPPKPGKTSSIMQKKLAASQKILEGLALNNFKEIKDNAELLNDLSKQAAWKTIETPRYAQYSEEFQRLTMKMAAQAKDKNIDGVALSYVDMTLLCVKCHQHTREVRVGQLPSSDKNRALVKN